MADAELTRGLDSELKALARSIIGKQTREMNSGT